MTSNSVPGARSRRLRNALLATVFSLGVVGGTGVLIANGHIAFAEAVRVEAPAPADFTTVVEQVAPAVVSVQVKTKVAEVADRFPDGMEDLPPGLDEFFRRFGMPREFGDQDDNRRPYSPRRGVSQGSGFFISEDGYLVTNAHVVEDGTEFQVLMDDGREIDAKADRVRQANRHRAPQSRG